ncbi:response regulator [Novosphingobium decolorationis]|uniref:Response regulator n=1 Tax=Novosphingobium decolorationis TaxID=2698673 RepID=A0ABX8E9F3_9SPHN|nr:response regulator [Novosphingobium decolorationis]QVM85743.1 response regulator [Novosphingobium decolorationis]
MPGTTNISDILVVDDMEANQAVIRRRLEPYGYRIRCVESGAAALKAIAERLPDIVLLDYMMPHMNGIEVLRILRQDQTTRELPIIMVTARAESEATIEALEAGADDYVTKPIDFQVLQARIATHVSKRSNAHNLMRTNAVLDERVVRRSMEIADLEDELKQQVLLRRELEAQIKLSPEKIQVTGEGGDLAELKTKLTNVQEKFEVLFVSALSGKSVNMAQMAEVRLLLANLCDEM